MNERTIVALIDAHHLGMRQTGNESWMRNVVSQLALRHTAHHLAVTKRALGEVPSAWPVDHVHVVSERSSSRLLVSLPRLVHKLRPQSLLVQYTAPLFVRLPTVLLIHDLSFEDDHAHEWLGPTVAQRMRRSVRWSASRAAVVLTPTRWTQVDVIERYGIDPDRVLVAPNAVGVGLAAALSRTGGRRSDPGAFNVLCVGTVLPRKNLTVVAHAVKALRSERLDVRLRLVGPVPPNGTAVVREITALLGPAAEFSGHVSVAELAQAYHGADVLAFPSFYEGFGIPLIEAMAAGVPVLSSSATCLPEVGADAAVYADASDLHEWTHGLRLLLTDSGARDRAIARGVERVREFSWEATTDIVERALSLAKVIAV
jgi:glycosyltransferase involved in cell wall biosynthesis